MSSYKWLVDKHFKKNCCYVIRNYIPTNLKYEQVYKNQLNVFNTSTLTKYIHDFLNEIMVYLHRRCL